jgi:transglutaminase-like putative cysteine protease
MLDFEIKISPNPKGIVRGIDSENNPYHQFWMNDSSNFLRIETKTVVKTMPVNPFAFLPHHAPTARKEILNIYLMMDHELSEDMQEWVHNVKFDANGTEIDFAGKVCSTIGRDWSHTIRYEANILDPVVCFNQKLGSCRDLAWMMIHMLRYHQIPARFVSGYAYNPALAGHELHAWVEVWLPGGGWIGLDPSSGLFTSQTYIPLAVSYDPENTMPVIGSFTGNAVSNLETSVNLKEISSEELASEVVGC